MVEQLKSDWPAIFLQSPLLHNYIVNLHVPRPSASYREGLAWFHYSRSGRKYLIMVGVAHRFLRYIIIRMAEKNPADSPVGLLLEAVNFAAIKHSTQRRKDVEKTPYINHPIGVAHILWKEGGVTDLATLQVSVFLF